MTKEDNKYQLKESEEFKEYLSLLYSSIGSSNYKITSKKVLMTPSMYDKELKNFENLINKIIKIQISSEIAYLSLDENNQPIRKKWGIYNQ